MKMRRELLAVVGLLVSALLIAVLGVFLLVLPQRSELKKVHARYDSAQTEIASIQASRAGGSSAQASQIYELSRAMPQSRDLPGIVLALSRVAKATSLKLDSVHPSTALVLSDGSSALPVAVEVEGSYVGVTKFLRMLRTQVAVTGQSVRAASRLFIADNVSLSALTASTTGASGPTGEVTATLNLVAYQYAKPVAPSATTGAGGATGPGSASSSSTSVSAAPQEGQ